MPFHPIANVMVYRAPAQRDDDGLVLDQPLNQSVPGFSIAIDRGLAWLDVLDALNPSIVLYSFRGDDHFTVVLNLRDVARIERGVVVSRTGSLQKGKTVFRMASKVETSRPLEDYVLKMNSEDHDRMHAEIMRVTNTSY